MKQPKRIETPLSRACIRIEEEFARTGGLTVHLADEIVPAAEWRRLMRMVAKNLGRPIETVANEHTVTGALKDWPRDAAERVRSFENQRRAVESLKTDPF